jgi:hypothetical protein
MTSGQEEKAPPRFVDVWLDNLAVMAGMDGGTFRVGWGMSRWADWHTGEGIRMSMPTLAARVGMTRQATERAVGRLETKFCAVERTGRVFQKNVKEYRLVPPATSNVSVAMTSNVSVATDDATSNVDVATDEAPGATSRPPEATSRPASSNVDVAQPPQTHQTLRSDEEEARRAASATATAGPRPVTAETRAATRTILAAIREHPRKVWREATIDATRLHDAVADRLAAGWSADDLALYALTIGGTPRGASGMLAAHLRRAPDDAAGWIEDQADEAPAGARQGDQQPLPPIREADECEVKDCDWYADTWQLIDGAMRMVCKADAALIARGERVTV